MFKINCEIIDTHPDIFLTFTLQNWMFLKSTDFMCKIVSYVVFVTLFCTSVCDVCVSKIVYFFLF